MRVAIFDHPGAIPGGGGLIMVNKCQCGCGTIIPDKDKRGRPRKFASPSHVNNIRIYKPLSKESIAKMKKTMKDRYPQGRIPWNKGIPLTNKTKKKLSKALKGRVMSKEARIKMGLSRRGNKNCNWKGGIIKQQGYIWIKCDIPELRTYHNYAKRCNLVWYEKTGEIIKSPYLLHHNNEDKLDDRFENLKKVTRATHINLHRKKNGL